MNDAIEQLLDRTELEAAGFRHELRAAAEQLVLYANDPQATTGGGAIFTGRSGSGKSHAARALAVASQLPFIELDSTQLYGSDLHHGESILRAAFDSNGDKHIVILDNIDLLIAPGQAGQAASLVERRMYGVLLALLDSPTRACYVLATTGQSLSRLPCEITRPGRLDTAVELHTMVASQRRAVLQRMMQRIPLGEHRDRVLTAAAELSHGCSPAELKNICLRFAMLMAKKPEGSLVEMVTDVCKQIRPSNLLEYSSVMQTSSAAIEPFSDIFGLDSAVKDLQILLDMWIRQPDKYTKLGIQCPRGVVIHGPTGTAKSMLATGFAQAASASGCNTVYIDGTMIRSAIVGESEARLADVFARVKESAPCVLLIDHLDMIAPRRGTSTSTENTDDRLVAMMLTEIDGIFTKSKRSENRPCLDMMIVATTSRRAHIDPALLRRGRLDMDIETSVPNDEQRRAIFQGIAQTMPVVLVAGELDDLVQKTSGMTGADIRGICTEAALHALRTDPDATVITRNNFKL